MYSKIVWRAGVLRNPARRFRKQKLKRTPMIPLVNLAEKRFYIYNPSMRLSYKTKQYINQLINLVKSYYSSESYQALRHKLNNSKEYYHFRRYCLTRDDYKCTKCSHHATQVHHIIEVKDNPRLALSVTNGISLCNDCHTLQHRWLTDGILNNLE